MNSSFADLRVSHWGRSLLSFPHDKRTMRIWGIFFFPFTKTLSTSDDSVNEKRGTLAWKLFTALIRQSGSDRPFWNIFHDWWGGFGDELKNVLPVPWPMMTDEFDTVRDFPHFLQCVPILSEQFQCPASLGCNKRNMMYLCKKCKISAEKRRCFSPRNYGLTWINTFAEKIHPCLTKKIRRVQTKRKGAIKTLF